MTHVTLVMTADMNVLGMGLVLAENASVIRATPANTVIHCAQARAHAVTALVRVKTNGRVNIAKYPNVQMIVQEKAFVTALYSLASVTQDGAERIAANLTVKVNRIVITEVRVHR